MNKKLIILLAAAFVFRLILTPLLWHPDLNNHIDWGIRFWEYGPLTFYTENVWNFTWPNQPPATMYMFAIIRKVYEAIFGVLWFVNIKISLFPSNIITFSETQLYPILLKIPAILADLGIAVLIYKFLEMMNKKRFALIGAFVYLANPVIWYNSSVWGQTDSIINFFILLSFYFLFKKRRYLSVFAFLFSLYFKVSLVIFLPIYIIIAIKEKKKIGEYIKATLLSILIIGILTIPFAGGEPFSWLRALYTDKIFGQQLQVITANAFNLWAFTTGISKEISHGLLLGPITYQVWGIILFILAYIPTLVLVKRRGNITDVVWSLSMAAISAFMLLTNMHERYLYPFFPVFTILAVTQKDLFIFYWVISGISLINMYNYWWGPRIEAIVNLLTYNDRIVARMLAFIAFAVFVYLYIRFLRHLKQVKI